MYQGEVDAIIEAKKDDKDFQPEVFVKLLQFCEAIKAGATPRMTDGLTRIDSRERALEVANEPDNGAAVDEIQRIMKGMIQLREKLNPLINTKSTCSIALKNKKSVKKDDSAADSGENKTE